MKRGPLLKVLGKVWRLVWVEPHERPRTVDGTVRDGEYGCCESPDSKAKRIMIRESQPDAQLLDTLIHEQLHAGGFVILSEEWVRQMGEDLAANILKVFDVKRREP